MNREWKEKSQTLATLSSPWSNVLGSDSTEGILSSCGGGGGRGIGATVADGFSITLSFFSVFWLFMFHLQKKHTHRTLYPSNA